MDALCWREGSHYTSRHIIGQQRRKREIPGILSFLLPLVTLDKKFYPATAHVAACRTLGTLINHTTLSSPSRGLEGEHQTHRTEHAAAVESPTCINKIFLLSSRLFFPLPFFLLGRFLASGSAFELLVAFAWHLCSLCWPSPSPNPVGDRVVLFSRGSSGHFMLLSEGRH